jgi:hypothetical protein
VERTARLLRGDLPFVTGYGAGRSSPAMEREQAKGGHMTYIGVQDDLRSKKYQNNRPRIDLVETNSDIADLESG